MLCVIVGLNLRTDVAMSLFSSSLSSYSSLTRARLLAEIVVFMFCCVVCSSCFHERIPPPKNEELTQELVSAKVEKEMEENYISLGESGYEAQLMSEFMWEYKSKNGWAIYTTPENSFFRYAITVADGESSAEAKLAKAPDMLDIEFPYADNWQPNLANQSVGIMGGEVKLFFKELIQTGCKFENDVPCTAYFRVIYAKQTDDSQRIIIVSTKRASDDLDPRGSISATIRPEVSRK